MSTPFVDPRPLYETEAPLSTRVGVFGRYLVVDSESRRLFGDVTRLIAGHSPIVDIGCGVGVPLLPVGPTVLDRPDLIAGDLSLRQLQSIPRDAHGSRSSLLQFTARRVREGLAELIRFVNDPAAPTSDLRIVLAECKGYGGQLAVLQADTAGAAHGQQVRGSGWHYVDAPLAGGDQDGQVVGIRCDDLIAVVSEGDQSRVDCV